MASYTLKVTFDPGDLSVIQQAGQDVVLIKEVPDGSKVAWVTFSPLAGNTVTWEGEYRLYSSTTPPNEGRKIIVNALQSGAARAQSSYTFDGVNFILDSPSQSMEPGQYMVINGVSASSYKALTFGLAQDCTPNSMEKTGLPITADLVPAQQAGLFLPQESVLIFLSSYLEEGVVHNNVLIRTPGETRRPLEAQSFATRLVFSARETEITVRYDAAQGIFVQQ
jgi:hypothetical protein